MSNQEQLSAPVDVWATGSSYEPYVGRWSRLVALEFLRWLDVPPGRRWLDVGCGTGAVSETILKVAEPSEVKGVDSGEGYIHYASEHIRDERAHFQLGDAEALPSGTARYDAVVSGLMLNFVPRPEGAIAEMARAAKPGGVVAVYVWDYAEKMQFMRHFWNAAAALDPAVFALDEGIRFPICRPEPLSTLFKGAKLKDVEVHPIDIWTDFKDFEDYWTPFLGGQGPAPGYVVSLTDERRNALRERLRQALPAAVDGSIPLVARAWAVRGIR